MLHHTVCEVILVGLPGPTHHYGGLSADNVASNTNRGLMSNPKQAALQALGLVQLLSSLGVTAGLLPPQVRPHMPSLRAQFSGNDEDVIARAGRENPALLEKISSSSAMWVANAATITTGLDALDGKLHLTPANLATNLHRRIEAKETHQVLAAMFRRVPNVVMHDPLPEPLRDEGAANHTRLAPHHAAAGLDLFVYGADGKADDPPSARQMLAASQAIAERHGVREPVFVKQNPEVIRQGVFHNDVIAVGNEYVLLAHEDAYVGGANAIDHIAAQYERLTGKALNVITIARAELSVEEAVRTYFFNSQLITQPDGTMALIAPTEVQTLYGGKAARLMEKICAAQANPIAEMHYCDLRQSMNNGGGPACLRLRVPMSVLQLAALREHTNVIADEALLANMTRIIEKFYPEKLEAADLANPELYHTCKAAVAEMHKALGIK